MGHNSTAGRPGRGKHVREAELLESPPFWATPLFSNAAAKNTGSDWRFWGSRRFVCVRVCAAVDKPDREMHLKHKNMTRFRLNVQMTQ